MAKAREKKRMARSNEHQQGLTDFVDQYQEITHQYQQVRDQCQQLQQIEHRLKREQQRLTRYMLAELEQSQLKTIEIGHLKIKVQDCQQCLVIDHDEAIPEDYISVNKIRQVDKTAVKLSLLKGKAIPGAHIETQSKISIEEKSCD